MEANNVNTDKKADVLNRIKEYSSKKVASKRTIVVIWLLVVCIQLYLFFTSTRADRLLTAFCALCFIAILILSVYELVAYKRIGRSNSSIEMNSLLKNIEIGPKTRVYLAIFCIVVGLAFSAVVIYEELNKFGSLDWVVIALIAFVIILFFGLACLLLKNWDKIDKSELRLLIDELQALEEEK